MNLSESNRLKVSSAGFAQVDVANCQIGTSSTSVSKKKSIWDAVDNKKLETHKRFVVPKSDDFHIENKQFSDASFKDEMSNYSSIIEDCTKMFNWSLKLNNISHSLSPFDAFKQFFKEAFHDLNEDNKVEMMNAMLSDIDKYKK